MTIAVFTFSLLGAMALGMPIAFALIVCGVALMSTIDMFDSQIVAQNVINGADSFPLMAIPVLHARRRDHEQGRAGQAHRQCRARRGRPFPRRARLRHDPRVLHSGVALGLRRGRCRRAGGAAGADDGGGGSQEGLCGGPRGRGRHHRARHPAQHRLRHLRRRRRRLDLQAVPGRHRARACCSASGCASPGGGSCARRT